MSRLLLSLVKARALGLALGLSPGLVVALYPAVFESEHNSNWIAAGCLLGLVTGIGGYTVAGMKWLAKRFPLGDLKAPGELEQAIGLLEHDLFIVRKYAAEEIESLGRHGQPAVGPLIKMLGHRHGPTRAVAAECLVELAKGGVGADVRASVPVLVALLGDRQQQVRKAAAVALARIAPSERSAEVRAILEQSQNAGTDLEQAAVGAALKETQDYRRNELECPGCKGKGCLENPTVRVLLLCTVTLHRYWLCGKCGLIFNEQTLKPVSTFRCYLRAWGTTFVMAALGLLLFLAWLFARATGAFH